MPDMYPVDQLICNTNDAPVANQARAALVRSQRIQRLVDITLGQLHQVYDRQH